MREGLTGTGNRVQVGKWRLFLVPSSRIRIVHDQIPNIC
ncbi:hypothetical protein FLM9_372 [Candidatus Synechococcus spongiarum]|uniref:Uncharacterized protein n=1 Tax=Candidatus Synechococcus spongiarum TaxID=431041 RepID=A0A164Y1U4_9SYNE|nr:hypothetical protein FLM9_372 [Candidatus Synechococcus spongiarum]